MAPVGFVPALALPARPSSFGAKNVRRNVRRTASRGCIRAVAQIGQSEQKVAFEAIGDAYAVPKDGQTFRSRAIRLKEKGEVPAWVADTLMAWFSSFRTAADDNKYFIGDATEFTEKNFSTLLELARRAVADPVDFQPYHEKIRTPFDYYKFGFDFASILLDVDNSTVLGQGNLAKAVEYVQQGHNVVFIGNHQSEGDPYAIDALFSFVANLDRQFCEEIIFMAGDRVRDDPVVSPFTVGRNLLTVYSKKHIKDVPELMEMKLMHNRRTIAKTASLFKEGGKVVWFAPSGGRDRRSKETGLVEVSPFDEGAVQAMRVTADKSGTPTHFFPLSLVSYDMLPPPSSVGGAQIGEERVVNHIPMHMYVSPEVEWKIPPGITDKDEKRKAYCNIVFEAVKRGYEAIGGYNH